MEFPANAKHACTFCNSKFIRKSKLESHLRSHIGEKPFYCDKCKRGYSTSSNLKLHVQNVHLRVPKVHTKTYKCSLCPYATHAKSSLDGHIVRKHTGERSFPCQHPNCHYSARLSSRLKQHNIQVHTNERKFKCPFPNCGYRGKTKTVVNAHYVTHSEFRPFNCDFEGCGYRAKSKNLIKAHKRVVHNGGYRPFACSMCSHSTKSRILLREHESRHSKEKPMKCDFSECKFACKTKSGLNQHVRNCHTEKKFRCDFAGCELMVASQSILELHKKNVHSEKVYKCSNCDFQTKYELPFRNHQERHNKVKQRIPCPYKGCIFRSIHQDSFKRHLASHKANLGCQEEGCGYVGRSNSSLKRHMQVHDPTGRPFHCTICSKHFFTNNHLRIHLRTHTKEQPFKCPVCNFGTVNKGNMVRRVRIIHSTTVPLFCLDKNSTCDHCHVNFGCALGLAMHRIKLKTAIVVVKRLNIS